MNEKPANNRRKVEIPTMFINTGTRANDPTIPRVSHLWECDIAKALKAANAVVIIRHWCTSTKGV